MFSSVSINMGVPSKTNRKSFNLGFIALAVLIVIVSLDDVKAENEQHLYYKEYERLQKQVKPVNYNWQDQNSNQQSTHRRIPNYQHPQFNFPKSTYGVQQQEQRQEQHIHDSNPRVLQIENTKYSVWSQNMTYKSSTGYNPLGMGQLYNLTNKALDFFIDKDEPIPPGYFVVNEMKVEWGPNVQKQQYQDILMKYWLIILITVVVVITAFLMPLIGLCFCCCRCAGACGGRTQPFDKKHDTCRRFYLGFFLLIIISSMVFGVIVAFVTNITLQQGVENATYSGRYAVEDSQTYLKSTSYHIRHLLVNNYGELKDHLFYTLDKTAENVVKQLDGASNAISLEQLNNIVKALPEVQENMVEMNRITKDMQQKANQLNDALRSAERNLLSALADCGNLPECKQVQKDYEIGLLDEIRIDYDKLPDQREVIADIQKLLDGNLQDTVSSSERKVKDVKEDIEKMIKTNVPEIKMSINKVGSAMLNISNSLTYEIDRTSSFIGNNTFRHFNTADEYIAQYSIYRYYGGLIIASVLLIVFVFGSFGLLCGICGKRPGYTDDCCTKGAGSRFLMCGVAIIFLTISALLIICLACFLIGLILHRGGCEPLKNPEHDQVFSYLDNFIDLNKHIFRDHHRKALHGNKKEMDPLRISHVIAACHRNESIFDVLRLGNEVNIDNIREFPKQFEIDKKLNELSDNVRVSSPIKILNDAARLQLRELSQSQLNSFARYKYDDNLVLNITKYNLDELADRLDLAVKRIPLPEYKKVESTLNVQALHLRTYQKNLVEPLFNGTTRLLALADKLNTLLLFKQSSFEKAIKLLIREIDEAERFLNEDGTEYIQKAVQVLSESFSRDINGYLDLVINTTKSDVGRCGPISNVYNSTIVNVCNRVVDPFNGFWAGILFCVLLFFPTIVYSAKLSSLYQISDPYPGPLVEAEYLYDAYSERDHIPLANVPKNKRRKNNRRQDGRDRRGDYFEEGSPSAGASSSRHHRDVRYTDMAPKNWDGAPPRYQSAHVGHPPGSEYERPPPYNFTGPYPVAPSED